MNSSGNRIIFCISCLHWKSAYGVFPLVPAKTFLKYALSRSEFMLPMQLLLLRIHPALSLIHREQRSAFLLFFGMNLCSGLRWYLLLENFIANFLDCSVYHFLSFQRLIVVESSFYFIDG